MLNPSKSLNVKLMKYRSDMYFAISHTAIMETGQCYSTYFYVSICNTLMILPCLNKCVYVCMYVCMSRIYVFKSHTSSRLKEPITGRKRSLYKYYQSQLLLHNHNERHGSCFVAQLMTKTFRLFPDRLSAFLFGFVVCIHYRFHEDDTYTFSFTTLVRFRLNELKRSRKWIQMKLHAYCLSENGMKTVESTLIRRPRKWRSKMKTL